MKNEHGRRISLLLCALFMLLTSTSGALNAANDQRTAPSISAGSKIEISKIDGAVMSQFQKGNTTRALIVFNEQADLSGADALKTKNEKGAFVLNALRTVANRTQARVRSILQQRGISFRAFYIANAIAVERLDATTATQLAAESNVARIAADPTVKIPEPAPQSASEATNGIQWGIRKIGAKKVWNAGYRGKGIVVANQDTGVEWFHPALKNKYRGYDRQTKAVDHSYNWWDAIHSAISSEPNPCGYNTLAPCDDYGHGTHTMGTLVGSDGLTKIGVAPKAKWISCRNMDQGEGSPSTYMECFEFFLAPWDSNGKNPDPNRAPDVVSNSWGCTLGARPEGEGCEPKSLAQATHALRAAGIFVSASAGNAGPDCSTITDPSAIYNASTTVGATTSRDLLASFSSRGPVADGSRKPDLSAPGVSVLSSIPGGAYAQLSGTSMAAPHLAGAVALLWQAKPKLRGDIRATEQALFHSAYRGVIIPDNTPRVCGKTTANDIPNNIFGWGRLDVWQAYRTLQ